QPRNPWSGPVGVASPYLIILDTRTLGNAGEPQVEEPRLLETEQDAHAVEEQRGADDPDRLEHQEQLGRNHQVDDEQAVGDASEHLRPRQADEEGVAFECVHFPTLTAPAWRSNGFRRRCWRRRTG